MSDNVSKYHATVATSSRKHKKQHKNNNINKQAIAAKTQKYALLSGFLRECPKSGQLTPPVEKL